MREPYLRRSLLAAAAVLLLLPYPSRADNPPDEPDPILAAAKAAIANRHIEKSKALGFHDEKRPFRELPDQGALLIGFDLGVGKFVDIDSVYALRPLYLTAEGEVSSEEHGLFRDRRTPKKVFKTRVARTVRVQARPGYAVGGITVRSGLNINGLSLTFMKISGKWLDPSRSYTSDWVGDRTGGNETSIGGEGAPVIGVHGSQDDDHVMSLGLYFIDEPPPPAPIPAAKPAPGKPAPTEKPAAVPPRVEQPAAEPADPAEEPEPAPADAGKAPAKEPVPTNAAQIWIPIAIFGAVAVPIFVVLLVSFGRKKQVPESDRQEMGRARVRPSFGEGPRAPASATGSLSEGNTRWSDPAGFHLPPVQSPAMTKAKWQVSATLFGIAAAQFVCGLVLISVIPDQLVGKGAPKQTLEFLTGIIIVIALVFAGLGFWARFQPLAAGCVGLGTYVVIFLLDFLANPQMVMQGILVKVAITSALVRAVVMAVKAQQTPTTSAGALYTPEFAPMLRPRSDRVQDSLSMGIQTDVPPSELPPWALDASQEPE